MDENEILNRTPMYGKPKFALADVDADWGLSGCARSQICVEAFHNFLIQVKASDFGLLLCQMCVNTVCLRFQS